MTSPTRRAQTDNDSSPSLDQCSRAASGSRPIRMPRGRGDSHRPDRARGLAWLQENAADYLDFEALDEYERSGR